MRLYIPTFYLSAALFLSFTAADHTLRGSDDLASVELDTTEIDNEEPDIVKPNIVEPDIAEPTNVDPDIGEPNNDSVSTYDTRLKDPLYRYWNNDRSDHLYTTDLSEFGNGRNGYKMEDPPMGFISSCPKEGLVALYRYHNQDAQDHFYTIDWCELKNGNANWKFEGITGFVSATPDLQDNLGPLYRYNNKAHKDHLYTINWGEFGEGRDGYTYEGIMGYVRIVDWQNESVY